MKREETYGSFHATTGEQLMPNHKGCLLLSILLLVLTQMAEAEKSRIPPAWRSKEEAAIQEAVLHALFAAYGKSVPHEVFYIDLAPNKDPSLAFLRRFQHHTPAVLVQSRAGEPSEEMEGLRDKRTGKKGTLFSVRKIKWLSPTRVTVDWRWYYWMRAGMGATYRVEKIHGHWKVKEIVPNSVFKN
jgi:hypothetical protein